MILVIVGTNYFPFDRLINYVDKEVSKEYQVTIQTGISTIKPQNARYQKYFSSDEMNELIQMADWVICHGGYGIIQECINYKKKIITVPRIKKNGECLDDQFEICSFLEQKKCLVNVRSENEIMKVLNAESQFSPDFSFIDADGELPTSNAIVSSYIENLIYEK